MVQSSCNLPNHSLSAVDVFELWQDLHLGHPRVPLRCTHDGVLINYLIASSYEFAEQPILILYHEYVVSAAELADAQLRRVFDTVTAHINAV